MMNTGANFSAGRRWAPGSPTASAPMNENLPGYVVLTPTEPLTIGSPLWTSSFLPAVHQGTLVHNKWVEDEKFKAEKVIPNIAARERRRRRSCATSGSCGS